MPPVTYPAPLVRSASANATPKRIHLEIHPLTKQSGIVKETHVVQPLFNLFPFQVLCKMIPVRRGTRPAVGQSDQSRS